MQPADFVHLLFGVQYLLCRNLRRKKLWNSCFPPKKCGFWGVGFRRQKNFWWVYFDTLGESRNILDTYVIKTESHIWFSNHRSRKKQQRTKTTRRCTRKKLTMALCCDISSLWRHYQPIFYEKIFFNHNVVYCRFIFFYIFYIFFVV